MSLIGYINIALEIFGSLISIIMAMSLFIYSNRHEKLNAIFICLFATNTLVLLSDAVAWGVKGHTALWSFYGVRIANFCVYMFGYLILWIFTEYLITFLSMKTKIPAGTRRISGGICIVAVILIIVSQFNHMFYYFDENNFYHRGDLFWLSQIWGLLVMFINTGVIIRYRKYLQRREFFSFLFYLVLPILAMVIQMKVYGLALLYIASTLSILVIYSGIQTEQVRRLQEKELELTENRIAIMLSQIQPHFLYNSLVVIQQLCDLDPAMAKEAATEFACYLRSNMDSLTIKKPIAFQQEIEHVENYLSLEKKRFGNRVNVVYDIQETDFMLPPLTLQPIVENAVRHGITKKEAGGTVTISTKLQNEEYVIIVADDGAGFCTDKKLDDGRAHVGIENVSNRVARMCNGRLNIASTPGEGTEVTIFIPKQ